MRVSSEPPGNTGHKKREGPSGHPAGSDEAKAKAAAEEIAHYDRRLNRIEVLLGIVVALQIATFGAVIFK